jgi:hypothetical protein
LGKLAFGLIFLVDPDPLSWAACFRKALTLLDFICVGGILVGEINWDTRSYFLDSARANFVGFINLI